MGFFSNIVGAVVETVTLPVSVVKDVVDVAQGKPAENTKEQVERIIDDVDDALSGR